jgi:hypothetical protein
MDVAGAVILEMRECGNAGMSKAMSNAGMRECGNVEGHEQCGNAGMRECRGPCSDAECGNAGMRGLSLALDIPAFGIPAFR